MSDTNTNTPLDKFLNPISSSVAKPPTTVPGINMSGLWERGGIRNVNLGSAVIGHAQLGTAIIGTANIGTLSFNQITGGTAILGGTTNGNGLLTVNDSGGTQKSLIDNTGITVFDLTSFNFALTGGGTYASFGADSVHNSVTISGGVGIGFRVSASSATFQMGAFSQGNFAVNCGTFFVNGTAKTAIVPTSQGYKALYCAESPEVWFFDFCDTKEKVDPLFAEVTEPPYHYIKCEGGEYQVWGKRKGFNHLRFEDKTEEQFRKNNDFWSTPNK